MAFSREEIPVDGVAERLVDADAVLIHDESLRQTEQRRRREAAELQVGLERIALGFVDVDARERHQPVGDGDAGAIGGPRSPGSER